MTQTTSPENFSVVTGLIGVWRNPYTADYCASVVDCNGGEWGMTFTATVDTEAEGFVRALQNAMGRVTDRPECSPALIQCRYNERADRHEIVVVGDLYEHRLPLAATSWVP